MLGHEYSSKINISKTSNIKFIEIVDYGNISLEIIGEKTRCNEFSTGSLRFSVFDDIVSQKFFLKNVLPQQRPPMC